MNRRQIILPLLAVAITCAPINYKAITDRWSVVYPSDPARRYALALCSSESQEFNRSKAGARTFCYEKWLPVLARNGLPQ